MKQAKLILSSLAFLLTILIFVQACKKDRSTDLSGTYEVSLNETKSMPENGSSVTITLMSIDDNRCPINANCISSGYALVSVKFVDANGEQTLELCNNCTDKKLRTNIIMLNGSSYMVQLQDITPFPDTSRPSPAKQTAKIIVIKQ